jgi:uncharacterized protein (TIGR02186 family)
VRVLRRSVRKPRRGSGARRRAGWGLLALGSLSLAIPAARAAAELPGANSAVQAALLVEPDDIRIDLFFNGARLHVRGTIPAGHQTAVLCTGNESKLNLRKKGQVWGFLWMNTADIAFDHVPSVYVLRTSAPVAQLAPVEVLTRLGVGYDGLEARANFQGSAGDGHALFGELVRLKKDEGLFSLEEGAALLKPGSQGRLEVSADLFLPARTPPGDYRITLYSFRDGEGAVVGETSTTLRQEGFAVFTSRMALERGLLYGIVSVVIAIAAGMLTGVAFGRGSKQHH